MPLLRNRNSAPNVRLRWPHLVNMLCAIYLPLWPSSARRGPILVLCVCEQRAAAASRLARIQSRVTRGDVFCDQCDHKWSDREMTNEPELSGLSSQFCISCGRLLPVSDSVNEMLGKLTQLARFGLDAESRPILAGGEDA